MGLPEAEDKKRPEFFAIVGFACLVAVNESRDIRGIENAVALEGAFVEMFARERRQILAQPPGNGGLESVFFAVCDVAAKTRAHKFFEQIFCPQSLEFVFYGQCKNKCGKRRVKKRRARFQSLKHTRAVRFGKNVTFKIMRHIICGNAR